MDERTLARFMAKVQKQPNGCWLWTSAKRLGYGALLIGSRKDNSRRTAVAHRLAYEHFVGSIPSGKELDHLCRTINCVNPDHLEPVTHRMNIRRGEWGKRGAEARWGEKRRKEREKKTGRNPTGS